MRRGSLNAVQLVDLRGWCETRTMREREDCPHTGIHATTKFGVHQRSASGSKPTYFRLRSVERLAEDR